MGLHRRELLKAGGALALTAALPMRLRADDILAPQPGDWRRYEIVTRVEIADTRGRAQAWVPLPSVNEADWFRSEKNTWTSNAPTAELVEDPSYGAQMLHLAWAEGETAPVAEVTSLIATQDRKLDLSASSNPAPLSEAERTLYTSATELIQVDGIVQETCARITAGATTDLGKAKAIYDWVVDTTHRDPNTRGCGIGDVAAMLESGNLGGKCADLNTLFVGLARSAGIPARDIYGLRVAPSRFGYAALGAKTETVTKSQHCRAEVFLAGFGWVPADPADVRKVILEEAPGNLSMDDPKVVSARETLFGGWEGNWLAYNMAHDLALPGSTGPKLGFLMYPQAEIGGERQDELDPDSFRYTITARPASA